MGVNKAIASATVMCYINGRPFGLVTGFRWSVETPKRPIHGLDQSEPFELAPGTAKVRGTIELVRSHGDGGLEGQGLVARIEDLTREKYFSIMLIDRLTDMTLFQSNTCSVNMQAWNVPVKGIITGSVEFEAAEWKNEFRNN